MLTEICPKLPMRDLNLTKEFYVKKLNFDELADYGNYLIVKKDNVELHFFEFKELNPIDNYGQVYIRTNEIDNFYKSLLKENVEIHPNGALENKPWNQREFALLDPDNNLLTFGQSM
ncbi:VOC family protein [Chryseobacterium koreense]|uniref:bleomycin resistance protein n=1 Tax=Chryseobacterium koreense TaxID=232216 RepID=UPI0026F00EB9|nr:VOC family protein [Chryseobacterium koreense]